MSTLTHAVDMLSTFGIDIEPERCDVEALRLDANEIREGICPPHLESCPPRFAADLLDTVADILSAR